MGWLRSPREWHSSGVKGRILLGTVGWGGGRCGNFQLTCCYPVSMEVGSQASPGRLPDTGGLFLSETQLWRAARPSALVLLQKTVLLAFHALRFCMGFTVLSLSVAMEQDIVLVLVLPPTGGVTLTVHFCKWRPKIVSSSNRVSDLHCAQRHQVLTTGPRRK